MTRLIVVAHKPLATALVEVAAHTYGECKDVVAVDVSSDDTPDSVESRLRRAIEGATHVLILTDVKGATPCNAVQRLVVEGKIHAVSGVNVPMLWRTLCYVSESLESLTQRALDGAKRGVSLVDFASSSPRNP
jgi:mannose PTS system EIIA component